MLSINSLKKSLDERVAQHRENWEGKDTTETQASKVTLWME